MSTQISTTDLNLNVQNKFYFKTDEIHNAKARVSLILYVDLCAMITHTIIRMRMSCWESRMRLWVFTVCNFARKCSSSATHSQLSSNDRNRNSILQCSEWCAADSCRYLLPTFHTSKSKNYKNDLLNCKICIDCTGMRYTIEHRDTPIRMGFTFIFRNLASTLLTHRINVTTNEPSRVRRRWYQRSILMMMSSVPAQAQTTLDRSRQQHCSVTTMKCMILYNFSLDFDS